MNRREDYTVDRRQIIRRNSKSLISLRENEEMIPIDLLIQILSRLPAKTIAKFYCLSKQWSSLLRDKYFTESFLTNSRPRLLFAFQVFTKWHFFSSLQPQNLGENITPDYHMSFSGGYNEVCSSSYGFIHLLNHRDPVTICNPSTGQQLTLPKVTTRNLVMKSFFGYDPIHKRFKVLCMTIATNRHQTRSSEHQVLTLGDGKKLSWRMIECSFPHYPRYHSNEICINGFIYYLARSNNTSDLIACFDVRSEKFSLIDLENSLQRRRPSSLMNYKGKLGVIMFHLYNLNYELWVLDETKKDKWCWKHVLPSTGHDQGMKSVWANDRGEIFWLTDRWRLPFYVYCYNVETKWFGKVEVKGIEEKILKDEFRIEAHFIFAGQVENLMFL